MATKPGLTEDEYLALVERIQQAMCIEPFCPNMDDVILLIGEWPPQRRKIRRLEEALDMVAEERDAWKARALGQPQEPCRHD